METQFRLTGTVVCSPYRCRFRRVFTGRAEHEPHQEKRACEGRTRYKHAVWPVTDAFDRADVDVDEPADPDGLGNKFKNYTTQSPLLQQYMCMLHTTIVILCYHVFRAVSLCVVSLPVSVCLSVCASQCVSVCLCVASHGLVSPPLCLSVSRWCPKHGDLSL